MDTYVPDANGVLGSLNRKVPDFGHKGTGYTRIWPHVKKKKKQSVYGNNRTKDFGIAIAYCSMHLGDNAVLRCGLCS